MKNDYLRRTWAVIHLDVLERNVAAIKSFLPKDCRLMAVVKAEAYGHGVRGCVTHLASSGANWFGVSNIEEALALRSFNIKQPILILGPTPVDQVCVLAENRITQAVFSPQYAAQLQSAATAACVTVDVHIKIDTGMGRIGFDGFDEEECARQVAFAVSLNNLNASGIFTHFSCADEGTLEADTYTRKQYERFMQIVTRLEQSGVYFAIRHCCNSAATLRFPEMHLDMVRPGIILYGILPGDCCQGLLPLQPIMELKSVASMIKDVPPGRDISYGRGYRTPEPSRLATIPIGYADGLRRLPLDTGAVLIRGRQAPIRGRICMDQMLVDVSNVPDAAEGDEVTLIGASGAERLTAEDWACYLGTIAYEVVCGIGKRVPRVFLWSDKLCGVEHY